MNKKLTQVNLHKVENGWVMEVELTPEPHVDSDPIECREYVVLSLDDAFKHIKELEEVKV
jgi:hypothetical protein